jgi:hypothetical protein
MGEFSDPFLLPSNEYFPTRLDNAWDFCAHLWYLNSTYRQASVRVCSHFITDIDFAGKSGDRREKNNFYDLLRDSVQVFLGMLSMGMDWSCFHGDTKVVTRDGVFKIKDLIGKRVHVLSKDGVYRPADFKSYGVQPLMEVEFSDGRKVYATPEHKWEVRNGGGQIVEVTTEELCVSSHRIKRTVAPRPERNEDYYEGVRHGFVFGDGSKSSKNRTSALFCGDKDQAMLPFFEGHGRPYIPRTGRTAYGRIGGLPGHFKELPPNEASASYWYGFVSGFLAADGTVDTHGCAMLTQCNRATLEAIEAQLPRIGMVAGPIRSQVRDTTIRGRSYKEHEIFFMTLLKQFVTPEDFILPYHREKFEARWDPNSKYGQWIRIQAVRDTERYEEVFCCVEMETHRIVIENGILTGQCYGNGFAWLYFPFNRYLIDDRDRAHPKEWALEVAESLGDVKYDYQNMEYEVWDPKTIHLAKEKWTRVKFKFRDRWTLELDKIRIIMLDPRYITLRYSRWSGRTDIIWRFDPEFVKDIKGNALHQINDTPIGMLRAVSNDQNFLFDAGEVFHLRAPCISGISNHGWGIPEVLANYREIHQVQVYRKIDEAVGLDYMLPFRMFSPNTSDSNGENAFFQNMGHWSAEVKALIRDRRRDPFAMHAMPFPVTYQEFGAEGKNLAPKEILAQQNDIMLDGMGYPAELFHGSLAIQQIPTTLRLFENAFQHLHRGFHNFLKWTAKRIQEHAQMETMEVSLQRPSLADDLEKRPIYLQLAAGGEFPRSLALKDVGVDDAVEAARERFEEDIEIEKVRNEVTQKYEREQSMGSLSDQVLSSQGGGAAGGVPAEGGGAGMTPLDTLSKAQQEAQTIVQMDQGVAQQRWDQLRAGDPNFYALVKNEADKVRSQAESQGRASLKAPPA